MKEMNPLETQLRSWTPRRPAPRLERRLFCRERLDVSLSRLATVLTPTVACVALTLFIVKQSAPEMLPDAGERAAMVALGLSNQNYAAYLPGAFQPAANRVDTFEWTNRGSSRFSMRSFTPVKATDLQ